MSLLREDGHEVWSIGEEAWLSSPSIVPTLDSHGIKHQAPVQPSSPQFEAFLQEQRFDMMVFMQWFWRGPNYSIPNAFIPPIRAALLNPRPLLILLTDDVNFEREKMLAMYETSAHDKQRRLNVSRIIEENERQAVGYADVIIAITDEDRARMRSMAAAARILVLPHFMNEKATAMMHTGIAGFRERLDVVFCGNGGNPTNLLSMQWFLANVWAKLQLYYLPGLRLRIVGNPPEGGLNWAARKGTEGIPATVIEMKYVDDLDAVLNQSRVFVSPIMMGTGMITKNLYAWSRGIPTLTTPTGIQGYHLHQNGEDALGRRVTLVATEVDDMINKIMQLYTDEQLWTTLSYNSRAHATNFLRPHFRLHVRRVFGTLHSHLLRLPQPSNATLNTPSSSNPSPSLP